MATVIRQKKQENPIPGYENLGFTVHPDCQSGLAIPFIKGEYQLKMTPEQKEYYEGILGLQFDSVDGQRFLDNFMLNIEHGEHILGNSPIDEFSKHLLVAHKGFGIVKTSDDETGPVDTTIFEFFDEEKNLTVRVNKKQAVNEAVATMQNLWDTKRSKLVLLAQYLLEVNSGVTNEITAYDRISDYIQNVDNAVRFLRASNEDIEHIDLVVTVKQAVNFAVIRSVNGKFQNAVTQTPYGRTIDEVVSFFSNPANQDELGTGTGNDEPYTIKHQLKNSNRMYS